MGLILVSPAFEPNTPIPRRYTADGEDMSPPLHIDEIPGDTVELALIIEDPDAPRPDPWIHWVVYKIPADTEILPEGVEPIERPRQAPQIEQGMNSWGTLGYRGPAPPRGHGMHHYHFRLFALREAIQGQGRGQPRIRHLQHRQRHDPCAGQRAPVVYHGPAMAVAGS